MPVKRAVCDERRGYPNEVHQVEFFLEFHERFEFLVLQLQGLQSWAPAGAGRLCPFASAFGAGHFGPRVFPPRTAFERKRSGGVDGLAAQNGELSALAALVGFAQNAKFVGGGEAAAVSRLADVGVRHVQVSMNGS